MVKWSILWFCHNHNGFHHVIVMFSKKFKFYYSKDYLMNDDANELKLYFETRLFLHFCDVAEVICSSIGWFSQIWLHTRYENRKNQSCSIFLATSWSLSYKSGNLDVLFFEIWRILVFFFMKKPFCIGQNHIFQVKIWQNFAQKKLKPAH